MMSWAFHGVHAQNVVTIHGHAFDKDNISAPIKLIVLNKRTSHGIFADIDGKFSISALSTDTILLSAEGFNLRKVSVTDSVSKKEYHLLIPLTRKPILLHEVSIIAPKTLKQIEADIYQLDSAKSREFYENIIPIESPITYLYERYSKHGKSRQKVVELQNEDLKRDILKSLFRICIKHGVINLNEQEFDPFIDYCNLSESFIKSASLFDILMAIKLKYQEYRQLH
jgi:hypothetical protein